MRFAVTLALVVAFSVPAVTSSAQDIRRGGWLPNNGEVSSNRELLGDAYTFDCPLGGSFTIEVETREDDENGDRSYLDPIATVRDGAGSSIASVDDNTGCEFPPVCGFSCPQLDGACGAKNPHVFIVRDAGAAVQPGFSPCDRGGGYTLAVTVRDKNGVTLPAAKVKFGGGKKRKALPFLPSDTNASGPPILDDEIVDRAP